jgi:hypothetical protein
MPGGYDMSVKDLAEALTGKDPKATLRIGVVTDIDLTEAAKVRTDQTGLAWIARAEDVRLAVDDRVVMLQQGGTFVVVGRLSGSPGRPMVKRKANTQIVTSSVTPVNDTDLWMVLNPGSYRINLYAHYSSAAEAADIRSLWDFNGSFTSGGRSCVGPGQITTAAGGTAAGSVTRSSGHGSSTAVVYGTDAGLTSGVLVEDFLIDVESQGTLRWQWAQGTSSASGTTVSVASRMYITPLQQVT